MVRTGILMPVLAAAALLALVRFGCVLVGSGLFIVGPCPEDEAPDSSPPEPGPGPACGGKEGVACVRVVPVAVASLAVSFVVGVIGLAYSRLADEVSSAAKKADDLVPGAGGN